MVRLTAKERVLLHLLDFAKHADAVEVPLEIAQEGIARAASFDLAHFSEYVRSLADEGLLRERMAHVKGVRQRRKVYDLTEAGKLQAVRLRERLKAEPVRLRDAGGTRDVTLAEVLKEAGGKIPVLEVLRRITEQGVVDLATLLVPAQPSLVALLPDMPRPGRFVGRKKELEEITAEEGARVFVVRGVAGIGKSMLGVQACELLRGRRNLLWRRVRSWDTRQGILASLAEFLAALGKPGLRSLLAYGDASQAAGLVREDLRDANAFLVFDDVHEGSPEVQSVLEMLKEAIAQGADARMLVLTRESPAFYGWRDAAAGGFVREIELQGLAPADVELLVDEKERGAFVDFGNRVGGHPLFLELARVHTGNPAQAMKDVRRFIEVEVFKELSTGQRTLMKTASLYRVPVPREALFSDPQSTYDILVSLEDKSLVRPVGEEAFEVHDTVRGFFTETFSPSERDHIGRFAVGQLRSFALKALEGRDFVSCLDYLSNALELCERGEERGDLCEALGDAQMGIGDLPAALSAYEEAAQLTNDPEKRARRCRKPADWRSQGHHIMGLAWGFEQVEAGFRALGGTVSVERGWLHLARGHLAGHKSEVSEARNDFKEALRVFQACGEERGAASSLYALGSNEALGFDGDPSLARDYLQSAIDLWLSLGDPVEAALAESRLSSVYAFLLGDSTEALRHITAAERLLVRPGDPHVTGLFLLRKGNIELYSLADVEKAKKTFEDAVSFAREVHDLAVEAGGISCIGHALFCEGRWDEARVRLETSSKRRRVATSGVAQDDVPWVALCYVMEGDLPGFRQKMEAMEAPAMQPTREAASAAYRSLQGIQFLVKGDMDRMHEAFQRAIEAAEGHRGSVVFGEWLPHFAYGVALRLVGQEQEGALRILHAEEHCRNQGLAVWLPLMPQMERRLTEVLRQWKADSGKS